MQTKTETVIDRLIAHVKDECSPINQEQAYDEMLEIVKRFEWSEWSNGKWCCPECGRMMEPLGEHREANDATNTKGCSIGLAIAKAEATANPNASVKQAYPKGRWT